MKDIPINDIYENIPVFNFKAPKDIYDKLLIKEPSTYDPNKVISAEVIKTYTDIKHNKKYKKNDIINVSEKRYIYLKSLDLVK
jgi:hypothetical protein